MHKEPASDVISVSAFLDRLNISLKSSRARIVGEVTGLQEYPGRSYLYFSIKDSKDSSTAKCFMWKNDYKLSGVLLQDGMEVIITAFPNIYKPNGGMTLQVETVELVGEGALKIAYDALKLKLENEGLLSLDRKRPIPDFPHRIGVITSKSGAVINDFLTNIGRFGFEIIFIDSKVEGQDAISDLLSAVATMRHQNIDVLVMMRGGGSLESFQAFNNELLVRAIASFPVPVLTGIGHDKDVSLVSLVSDNNVSTPTAVTTILNTSWSNAQSVVGLAEEKITAQYASWLKEKSFVIGSAQASIEWRFVALFDTFKKAELALGTAIQTIESYIQRSHDLLAHQVKTIIREFENMYTQAGSQITTVGKEVDGFSPMHQLERGYSIIRHNGKVVRKRGDTQVGDRLDITVSDGTIETLVQ